MSCVVQEKQIISKEKIKSGSSACHRFCGGDFGRGFLLPCLLPPKADSRFHGLMLYLRQPLPFV